MSWRAALAWAEAEEASRQLKAGVDVFALERARQALMQALQASHVDDTPIPEITVILLEQRLQDASDILRLPEATEPPRPKPAPNDRRGKHKELRASRIAAGLCTSCGRARDREGVTCHRCLDTDKKWRADRAVREKTAEYLDDECQPLVLAFPTRMLPVLGGPRYDCVNEDECLSELVKACGRQDAPGSSCPKDCPSREDRDARREFEHDALSRSEMV